MSNISNKQYNFELNYTPYDFYYSTNSAAKNIGYNPKNTSMTGIFQEIDLILKKNEIF